MAESAGVRTVGVLYNPQIAPAVPLAQEIVAWIKDRQEGSVQVCTVADAPSTLCWPELDLLVTLGGDGSILHAAHAAAPHSTPILGINLGRVGFLTEAEPETWQDVLARVLRGDYWIEKRMMLQVVARRHGDVLGHAEALNDVVVGRGARAQQVHLYTEVDGGYLATYVADGLIVATPTGSTAYALAAGGPVLPPRLRNILLVPVAPHLSMERPVVLSEGVMVHIIVTDSRPAVLTVDGEVQAELESGDEVVVGASPHVTCFARVQEQTYFYKTLVTRLVPRNHLLDSEFSSPGVKSE